MPAKPQLWLLQSVCVVHEHTAGRVHLNRLDETSADCWVNTVLLLKTQDNMRLYLSVADYDSVVLSFLMLLRASLSPFPSQILLQTPNPRIYLLEILEDRNVSV